MPDNERVLIVCRESGLGFISVVNINIISLYVDTGYSAESVSIYTPVEDVVSAAC